MKLIVVSAKWRMVLRPTEKTEQKAKRGERPENRQSQNGYQRREDELW